MIKIQPLRAYSPEMAQRVRELLIQLSRSGKDKGEIPRTWFEEIIASPSHDLLLAYEVSDDSDSLSPTKIVGMATLTLTLGPGILRNAYLEDFVTDSRVRGQGVGGQLWEAMLQWSKAKGALRLEFTCGQGRENAQAFYEYHGAEKYPTNFYRKELS